MIENVISEVIHRLIKDLATDQLQLLETTLYVVLDKYEISQIRI